MQFVGKEPWRSEQGVGRALSLRNAVGPRVVPPPAGRQRGATSVSRDSALYQWLTVYKKEK